MTLLVVERLDARHGLLQAVREVSLEVEDGETVALVGANGAGKTTLLRAIAGAHRLNGGRVTFDGVDVTAEPAYARVRRGIALVPEGRRLFPDLTVEDNLRVAGAARGGEWRLERVLDACPLLGPLRPARSCGDDRHPGGRDRRADRRHRERGGEAGPLRPDRRRRTPQRGSGRSLDVARDPLTPFL